MNEMILLSGLTKRFGPVTAVEDVSLSIKRGEVLGFLGPNGAGKSTTMRMVTGFVAPSEGTVTVCGFDVSRDPLEAQKRIGYMPEGAPLYGDITPLAFLRFIAGIRGFRGQERDRRVDAAIDKLELKEVLHRPIETLSKGYKRRTGLAQSLLHDPDILILDEPTDGLDPNQKHQVRELIRNMSTEKAIVISTHILEEVGAVCTRAVVIARGRVVFDGTPVELQQRSARHNAVALTLKGDQAAKARSEIEGLANVSRVEVSDGPNGSARLIAIPEEGRPILQAVGDTVRQSGIAVESLHLMEGQLDEVFRHLTAA
ncbi:MAG: ABC transporter ATP-binding protein [Rhodospirillales bacterium]|nr:ABC transporter ATP-binding protein [Rhodospirillales bacterium]